MTRPRRTTRLLALSAVTALSLIVASLAPTFASTVATSQPVETIAAQPVVTLGPPLPVAPAVVSRPAPKLTVSPALRAELALHLAGRALLPAPAAPAQPAAPTPVKATIAAPVKRATVKPKASKPATAVKKTTVRKATTAKTAAKPAYSGRNHVWIPSLGINKSTSPFACSRTRPPDNYVYRWGCAGKNNVYLMGHAYSVFKPLHDAYVSGRLKKGMVVVYADGAGTIHTYKVAWWKVTLPTTDASWAWAPQPRPSMTLQTCVGKNSSHRLMVRLLES